MSETKTEYVVIETTTSGSLEIEMNKAAKARYIDVAGSLNVQHSDQGNGKSVYVVIMVRYTPIKEG